ncbi:hypothetical protein [Bradyrhizobium sp. CCGE-LA001]|uniref:hypothetical protein n=1 Tax=Bradyrhizobium sp. CCGE-LA001 TaxID=1223566 RepID=UPI000745E21E|nr:hypothetical protein [Bradyrhizobium sp. CCGE-LA001]AMA60820.1 hypothetical protein BCCGELA001_34530 [Bradyrhizobium sp. CCGE-LA001]
MAGLVPAIHALTRDTKNVDARDKPGHDSSNLILPPGEDVTSTAFRAIPRFQHCRERVKKTKAFS